MKKWSMVALGTVLGLASTNGPSPAAAAARHAPSLAHTQAYGHRYVATSVTSRRSGCVGPIAHSGHVQRGMASVYAALLRGRRMADGTRFDPASDAAASKTLPLGTTARVTNLENGRAVKVRVRDRGPHVRGRILDMSPRDAKALGMKQDGIMPVAVAPMTDPLARGH